MSIIVHPFTAGADGKPAYTADQFRRTNTVWLSPVDTTTTATSTGVSGIRNEVNGPICTISGSTVTVKDHAGIVYPFKGGAPYTYFVQDESVTLESTTQSYKIALVVTDPSAGIGSTAGATIQALPSTTPDSNINGMVLAQVVQGVVSDVAPRLLSGTIIQTQTLAALQQIKTTDGQKGRVATTGDTYTYLNGTWVIDKVGITVEGPKVITTSDDISVTGTRYGRVVTIKATWKTVVTSNGYHGINFLPKDWAPVSDIYFNYTGTTSGMIRRIELLSGDSISDYYAGRISYMNEPGAYQETGGFSVTITYICRG